MFDAHTAGRALHRALRAAIAICLIAI
ncbi:MAG: hypothetical protein RIS88_420, partial [Pseudomonadota bacterium]